MTAGFTAAIICLALIVVSTMRIEGTRDEQARLVHHTQETLLAVREVGALFQTAATSLGAILGEGTGWERDLSLQAVQRLEPAMARLRALVDDDPLQVARLERLRPLVQRLAGRSRAALLALNRGERQRAHEILDGVGPAALAEAEGALGELERREEARLAEFQVRWRTVAVVGAGIFAAAALVLLLLILQAARLVRAERRERERLSAQRAEMVAQQRQVMAVVSHDLRNPLTAMKNTAAVLARSETLADEHREDARRIVSSARRMERLLRDLLDFSRIRAGKGLPVDPRPVDLVELSRLAVSDLGRDAEGQVTVEALGDVHGSWDEGRLEQVVANLVSNALKYGPALRPVRIVIDGTGGDVLLSVRDEGGTVPPGLRAAIFEPFRRGQAGDEQAPRSAGLGLFIVRQIAEAHGGGVDVDSAPGRGTTFTVRLPRGPAPGAAPAAAGG